MFELSEVTEDYFDSLSPIGYDQLDIGKGALFLRRAKARFEHGKMVAFGKTWQHSLWISIGNECWKRMDDVEYRCIDIRCIVRTPRDPSELFDEQMVQPDLLFRYPERWRLIANGETISQRKWRRVGR